MIAQVLLEVAIRKPLDYSIPAEFLPLVHVGSWIEVPLRNSFSRGYVIALKEHSEFPSLQPIHKIISSEPIITQDLFSLALWMAQYYGTPIEKVLRTMMPSGVRKSVQQKKQFFVRRACSKEELAQQYIKIAPKAPQQAKVLDILLLAKGGILLSELAEKAQCTPSVIHALHDKGLLLFETIRGDAPILEHASFFQSPPKILRPEQQTAVQTVCGSIDSSQFSVHLLHGVTGSGKTEVYMHAIAHARSLGKSVLMLVPEISLTQQTIVRFQSRFSEKIAVLHHRLSDGERHDTWHDILTGKASIVIGARSAIFSPLSNLGLIIIDEEHEQSYKQTDDSPSYHARDVGVMRGKLTHSTVLLGSATPMLESFYNASLKKYNLLTLSDRGSAQMPTIHIVDMKREYEKSGGMTLFSEMLLQKIEQRQHTGEKIILFLNRRGYHTTSTCTQCGYVATCQHCDTSMTFHKSHQRLACHLCGYEQPPLTKCPSCGSAVIRFSGIGTEKVESMLRAIFPSLRILRADGDSTKHKGSLDKILHGFKTGKADLLIGTQMIAKGLHFPDVTLVGVLNCDGPLNIPDFRAQESVFQLITQVSGRSGRGFTKGEVVIQTSLPTHPAIVAAAAQDYNAFFSAESSIRQTFGYPPYSQIVKFIFQGTDEKTVTQAAQQFFEALHTYLPASFICHPPLPCGHARVRDKWRVQCLLRGPSVMTIMSALEHIDAKLKRPSSVGRFCDVHPTSTFF